MPPPIDNSIQREYWVAFNPIAAISGGGVIELNIRGTSVHQNLTKTKLQVSYAITHADGTPIVDDRVSGVPTANSDQVAFVNLTLHSIFLWIDLSLNQKIVSPDVGVNYPYKAMIHLLLNSNSNMTESKAETALFRKDQAERFEEVTYPGNNPAFAERARPTKDGGITT